MASLSVGDTLGGAVVTGIGRRLWTAPNRKCVRTFVEVEHDGRTNTITLPVDVIGVDISGDDAASITSRVTSWVKNG